MVGTAHDVWGDEGNVISASKLPKCDYLEIDAEGAELDILHNLTIRPQKIAVEAHPPKGVTVEETRNALENMGYAIQNTEVKVPGQAIVLIGVRD